MSKDSNWRGVYVIVPTPFTDDLRLDVEGLRRTVRFCVDCGAHGLVGPANASEQLYLTDDEIKVFTETMVAEASGRATVVAGVTSPTGMIASSRARHAQAAGADALMAMPPSVQRATEPEIKAYYGMIDAATTLPIFLQNYGGPGGTPMSARFMAELLRDLPNVRFVKEETEFSSIMTTAVIEAAGADLEGVMGGKAGRHLLDEFRRGVCGTMPACEVTDILVALWNALDQGDAAKAREIYRWLLPLLMFETGYGTAVYKEVLRRRGVIASSAFRQTGGRVLDEHAHADLTDIMNDLKPLMHPKYPTVA